MVETQNSDLLKHAEQTHTSADDNASRVTRVLFVDDDPRVLSSLKRLLKAQRLSCVFEGLTSAQEALERIRKGGLDLIVSDIKMPGMDGIEMLARLKGNAALRNVPIIMLTGEDDSTIKNVALELGAVEFLNKPVDPDEFTARVSNVLAASAYQRNLEMKNHLLEEQISQIQRLENIGFMAAGIVHDAKNMVATLVGKAELCQIADSEEKRHELLQNIISTSQQTTKFLEQILHLSRAERNDAQTVSLSRAIDEIVEILHSARPVDVKLSAVTGSDSYFVKIPNSDLSHIILNICINAFQAMGDSGEVVLKLDGCTIDQDQAAEYDEVSSGAYVKLEICDNGPGIPADQQERIFEPFYTTKHASGGTGLGLAVVKRLVSQHHGFIELQSEPGAGTCFRIYLPEVEN
ncbi:MAG TPA: response regulator [candidate division Zixibacteria bacterium]|nr:response regulator [candidate division Zixibacteria bacterium]